MHTDNRNERVQCQKNKEKENAQRDKFSRKKRAFEKRKRQKGEEYYEY